MRHNDVIYLVGVTVTYDSLGNPIKKPTKRMVYANRFSINSSEFYDASRQGLKPEKDFEIYSFEYEGEETFNYDEKEYTIIRTQQRGEKIRLIGEVKS